MPDGRAAVWRTRDAGEELDDQREGLPQDNAYFGVLRQAMATDQREPAGVYFGTTGRTLRQRERGRELDLHRPAPADDPLRRDAVVDRWRDGGGRRPS